MLSNHHQNDKSDSDSAVAICGDAPKGCVGCCPDVHNHGCCTDVHNQSAALNARFAPKANAILNPAGFRCDAFSYIVYTQQGAAPVLLIRIIDIALEGKAPVAANALEGQVQPVQAEPKAVST